MVQPHLLAPQPLLVACGVLPGDLCIKCEPRCRRRPTREAVTYLHRICNLLTCLPTYLTTYLLTCLPTCLPTYLTTYSLTCLLAYLLTYLLTYLQADLRGSRSRRVLRSWRPSSCSTRCLLTASFLQPHSTTPPHTTTHQLLHLLHLLLHHLLVPPPPLPPRPPRSSRFRHATGGSTVGGSKIRRRCLSLHFSM